MVIGIIGGLERSAGSYRDAAARAGHAVLYHGGHVGGRGAEALESVVAAADVVVVITDINSHGAVAVARRAAKRRRVPFHLCRRLSPARLAGLMK